jgi:N-formylglutamate amidohydrolase
VVEHSLRMYDDFYAHLRLLLDRLVARHGRVVVFDLHSYNHKRNGSGAACDAPQLNPEINLGTGSMDRARWAPLVDRWLTEMRDYDYFGRRLDVRENVRFFGGQIPTWIHQQFPKTVCALAVEVKKFFMNEWTGELDTSEHRAIGEALARAARGIADELSRDRA